MIFFSEDETHVLPALFRPDPVGGEVGPVQHAPDVGLLVDCGDGVGEEVAVPGCAPSAGAGADKDDLGSAGQAVAALQHKRKINIRIYRSVVTQKKTVGKKKQLKKLCLPLVLDH